MRNGYEFGNKAFYTKTFVSGLLLVPAMFWWTALAVTLARVLGLAEYLGGSVKEVVILVLCPLLATVVSLTGRKTTKLNWLMAIAGFTLAAIAFLASLRTS